MPRTVTAYMVRDLDPHAIPVQGQWSSVGFQHSTMGRNDARQWATSESKAGRELVVVEVVDGAETDQVERFKDGHIVP